MATYYRSSQAQRRRPASQARGPEEIVLPFTYAVTAALVINDVFGFQKLAPRHLLTDLFVSMPDLDSNGSPAFVCDFGLWEDDSDDTTVPTVANADTIVDGSTVGQAAGLITAPNVSTFLTEAVSNSTRIIGMLVAVAPATSATSGTIQGYFRARNARYDDA